MCSENGLLTSTVSELAVLVNSWLGYLTVLNKDKWVKS